MNPAIGHEIAKNLRQSLPDPNTMSDGQVAALLLLCIVSVIIFGFVIAIWFNKKMESKT